mmetsp:Transcript_38949/g.84363  ORF Transcript_38949/g.84363 Transcript_38949/m.84363 type:complete len:167 (-) Transcript_38949:53-553(-)
MGDNHLLQSIQKLEAKVADQAAKQEEHSLAFQQALKRAELAEAAANSVQQLAARRERELDEVRSRAASSEAKLQACNVEIARLRARAVSTGADISSSPIRSPESSNSSDPRLLRTALQMASEEVAELRRCLLENDSGRSLEGSRVAIASPPAPTPPPRLSEAQRTV